jgi:glutamate racemase
VIEPGAEAAVAASRSYRIAVLATEGTVQGGAYQRAILQRRPDARVCAIAATLFVALAEEGWIAGDVAVAVARRYLAALFDAPEAAPDVLVLGCTHFPPLVDAIRQIVPPDVRIVDSALTTAAALAGLLPGVALAGAGAVRFLVTDGEDRFARVGPVFLGHPIALDDIERVDL